MKNICKLFGISYLDDRKTLQINWDILCQNISEFELMKTIKQRPDYHAEGTVFNHTRLAVDYYLDVVQPEYSNIKNVNIVMLLSVLLHDIGKVFCAIGDDGYVKSGGHEKLSVEWIQEFFIKKTDIDWDTLRNMVTLVKYHDLRYKYRDMTTLKVKQALNEIDSLYQCSTYDILNIFDIWRCDYCGSIGTVTDDEDVEDAIRNIEKIYYRDPLMIVMCGLPGAGKNHFIENSIHNYIGDHVVISRDDIREELGITTGIGTNQQEDSVTKIFNSRLQEALSNHQNIVINNTNIRKKYRKELIEKAKNFGYRTRIYVVCRPYEKLREARPGDTWEIVIDRMIKNFEIPTGDEAENVIFINNHS